MPSEERIGAAVEALKAPLDAFRSALAQADEDVRTHRLRAAATGDPGAALAAELGPFASGKIDPVRLAGLLAPAADGDPELDRLMERAHDCFVEVLGEASAGFRVVVPPGGDLRDEVRDALARLGRAFGISHRVRRAGAGAGAGVEAGTVQGAADDLHPFHRWNPRERELAPPLVVSVQGADLRGEGLAEFLDGRLKIVLVVSGRTSPAPLARLIAHGVFVAEGSDSGVVRRLALHPGPGVVAQTEEDSGAVAFVHDPASGDRTWTRLVVDGGTETLAAGIAELERRGRGGPRGSELRHLLDLVTPPAGGASGGGAGGAAGGRNGGAAGGAAGSSAAEDAEDRLAAWLLARTDVADL